MGRGTQRQGKEEDLTWGESKAKGHDWGLRVPSIMG